MDKRIMTGASITAVLSLVAFFLGQWIGGYLHPLIGVLFGLACCATTWVYVFYEGLISIPVGSNGIGLWLGKRVEGKIYPEGWCWNWPKPFGTIEIVDVREKTLVVDMEKVLTEDGVPVQVALSLQVRVEDLFKYKSVDNPDQACERKGESATRLVVAEIKSGVIGAATTKVDIEAQILTKLQDGTATQWGLKVIAARVEDITRPQEMDEAQTKMKVEEAQRASEQYETDTLVSLMEAMRKKFPGLSDGELLNAVQAERGKVRRIIIDGSGSDTLKHGALVGGALGVPPNDPSSNHQSHGTPMAQRRRSPK
jgi:regulator of protease activity HflC (stomatin/prohibitin superfamily)